jgi:predicted amidohydrolase
MKVAIYQMEDRGNAKLNIKQAYITIIKSDADFFVLPEFFAIPGGDYKKDCDIGEYWRETGKPALEMLKEASCYFSGYIIGGSILEKAQYSYYNTCYIFRNGQEVAKYRKINITRDEVELGVSRGKETLCLNTTFGRIGVLICADCINAETVDRVASQSDYIFLPLSLTDPNHPKFEGHPVSVRISHKYNVTVVKVARIGIFGGKKLVSQSAFTTPKGVIFEAGEEEELSIIEI